MRPSYCDARCGWIFIEGLRKSRGPSAEVEGLAGNDLSLQRYSFFQLTNGRCRERGPLSEMCEKRNVKDQRKKSAVSSCGQAFLSSFRKSTRPVQPPVIE